MTKRFVLIIFIAFFALMWGDVARAGFGISPPYVKTSKPIFPGSHYEQRILLLRSSTEEDLEAQITIDAPDVESWISIDKGTTFDLPKGELQVPMIVKVDVPGNAEIGDYKGSINVRIMPKEKKEGGGVAIALGARIDIELSVTNEEFLDFLIRKVEIPDFETLGKPWEWKIFSWFFYRVKVIMTIENTGNTKVAPSKVQLDVYDLTEKKLLESHTDKFLKKVKPFMTEDIVASFPTDLKPGQYWAKVKAYKDKDIVYTNKIAFTIVPHGQLPGGTKLGIWPWLMLLAIIVVILILIVILIKIRIWRHLFKILFILSWPIRFIFRLISGWIKSLKLKFWKWVGKKASKYQDTDKS